MGIGELPGLAEGLLTSCVGGGTQDTYSKPQHFIVLGIHGLALFSPAPRNTARVRLCIEGNPPQFKYNVSLSLGGVHSRQVSQLPKGARKRTASLLGGTSNVQDRRGLCPKSSEDAAHTSVDRIHTDHFTQHSQHTEGGMTTVKKK